MPAELEHAALAAYSFRTLDAELARLTFDSLAAGAQAVRGGGPRLLAFTAGATAIEVEIAEGRLVGRLQPPAPARVEVRSAGQTITVSADALGRFIAEPVGRGPLSLRCRLAPDRTVVTDWVHVR